MTGLGECLAIQDILLDVEVHTRTELFEQVARLWEGRPGLDGDAVVTGLAAREAQGSTALGLGVAIPHTRITGLDRPVAALARTREPSDFDAPDALPANLFFLLVVPRQGAAEHLSILAEVAERFSSEAFRTRLVRLASREAVWELFINSGSPLAKRR